MQGFQSANGVCLLFDQWSNHDPHTITSKLSYTITTVRSADLIITIVIVVCNYQISSGKLLVSNFLNHCIATMELEGQKSENFPQYFNWSYIKSISPKWDLSKHWSHPLHVCHEYKAAPSLRNEQRRGSHYKPYSPYRLTLQILAFCPQTLTGPPWYSSLH